MYSLYFADKAFGRIDQISAVSRNLVNDLYEVLCCLERDGLPADAMPIPDLVDEAGLPVNGFMVGLGKFNLFVSEEGANQLIIWEIMVRAFDN